jgi:hypothetical protein
MPRGDPFERLSKRQRATTTLAFARHLLDGVLARHPAERVAVLWVMRRSNYNALWPTVQLWTERADAHRYNGPWPVICHPPCGPWGQYHKVCKQSREHGLLAMELVHRWGGVVEQPATSCLFRLHGDGRAVEHVRQGDFGFPTPKPTILYWV